MPNEMPIAYLTHEKFFNMLKFNFLKLKYDINGNCNEIKTLRIPKGLFPKWKGFRIRIFQFFNAHPNELTTAINTSNSKNLFSNILKAKTAAASTEILSVPLIALGMFIAMVTAKKRPPLILLIWSILKRISNQGT